MYLLTYCVRDTSQIDMINLRLIYGLWSEKISIIEAAGFCCVQSARMRRTYGSCYSVIHGSSLYKVLHKVFTHDNGAIQHYANEEDTASRATDVIKSGPRLPGPAAILGSCK